VVVSSPDTNRCCRVDAVNYDHQGDRTKKVSDGVSSRVFDDLFHIETIETIDHGILTCLGSTLGPYH
jgi:hypothetical protein